MQLYCVVLYCIVSIVTERENNLLILFLQSFPSRLFRPEPDRLRWRMVDGWMDVGPRQTDRYVCIFVWCLLFDGCPCLGFLSFSLSFFLSFLPSSSLYKLSSRIVSNWIRCWSRTEKGIVVKKKKGKDLKMPCRWYLQTTQKSNDTKEWQ